MEQKDIDIYEILKDVPKGTEFYTPLCGNVGFSILNPTRKQGEPSGQRIRTESIPSTRTADG